MRFSIQSFSVAVIAVLSLLNTSLVAQEVSYNVIDNEPKMPKLRAGLTLFHLDAMFAQPENITAGIGLYGGINLNKRLGFSGSYYLPVYQSGRTSFQAGGFLAFRSKMTDQDVRVNLKSFGNRVSYINVPSQVLKQTRLRYGLAVVSTDQLGSVVDETLGINMADVPYRTRSQMFYAGISRFWGRYAKIDADDYGVKKGGMNVAYGMDVMVQGVTIDGKADVQGEKMEVTPAGPYSPLGMRFVIELENLGGLFPFGMYLRAGWRPGFVEEKNSFMEFGWVVPLVMTK